MPAPVPASPSAQWAADPYGRHELRYWDGTSWTHHVADNGVARVDPPASSPQDAVADSMDGAANGRSRRRHLLVGLGVASGCLAALLVGGSVLASGVDDVTNTSQPSQTAGVAPSAQPVEPTPRATPSATRPAPSTSTAVRPPSPSAKPSAPARSAGEPAAEAAAVVRVVDVIDGDTVDVSTGERIRVIGIDTPERGECGYVEATRNLTTLVLNKAVKLSAAPAKDDQDAYGRLLRYVNVGRLDAGLDQLTKGLAVARYDSRDGYGQHPRESQYIAADRANPNLTCAARERPAAQPTPIAKPKPRPVPKPKPAAPACHPSYAGACLPIVADLDCSDISVTVRVVGPDQYRLDRDRDGYGCE